jgi:hypothetical protein
MTFLAVARWVIVAMMLESRADELGDVDGKRVAGTWEPVWESVERFAHCAPRATRSTPT